MKVPAQNFLKLHSNQPTFAPMGFLHLFSCFAGIMLLLSSISLAQNPVPQGINYQAIARNAAGGVLSERNISVKFSLLPGSASANPTYSETHQVQTNAFGLFNLKIGTGIPVLGNFADVNWSEANQWLHIEIDPQGGSSYIDLGTNELLSVPYAFYAQSSGGGGEQGPPGPQGPQGETGPAGPQGPPGEGNAGPPAIQADIVAYGSADTNDPPIVSLGGAGTASAATLWVENLTSQCAVCTQPYAQTLPNWMGYAVVLDIPVQTITLENDGQQGKGVLIMGNVTIKATNNSTSLGNSNRYSIWVQRSTSPDFSSDVSNVYRIEDGLSGGITNTISPPPLASGTACTTIIYPDLNLSPGTYYYRFVFQNIMGLDNGQKLFAQDRNMVLMEIRK